MKTEIPWDKVRRGGCLEDFQQTRHHPQNTTSKEEGKGTLSQCQSVWECSECLF